MFTITQRLPVTQTRNSKYQKAVPTGTNEPIYTIGFQNCAELDGKTVKVTVEVVD